MTVISAVQTPEGVLLVTDRSTQYNELIFDDYPRQAPDQIKVETTRNRVHIAIAGILAGGPKGADQIDLLELARISARSTSNPGEAANMVRQDFDGVSTAIRAGAQAGTFTSPLGSVEALTAVILVGMWEGNIEVHEVALTASGLCVASTGFKDSLVFAPPNSLDEFKAAATEASHKETMEEAATVMIDAVHRAAVQSPGYVSFDADFVTIYRDGTSIFTPVPAPELTFQSLVPGA